MKKRFLAVITTAVLLSLTSCDLSISRPVSSVSSATPTVTDTSGNPTSGNPSSEVPTSETPTSVDPTSESTQPTVPTSESTSESTSSGSSTTSSSSSTNPTSTGTSEQPTSTGTSEQPTSTGTTTSTPIVSVTSVSLNVQQIEIDPYGSYDLVPTVLPENATNRTVRWSSSNPSVAVIDSNGHVIGLTSGTSVITVTTNDGNKTAQCNVTVRTVSHTVAVTGVTLDKTAYSLALNSSLKLNATVLPSNATNKGISWSSSNNTVAAVDAVGNVSALAVGTSDITVVTADGNKTAVCKITVYEPEQPSTSVQSVTINPTAASMKIGETKTLTYTILPTDAKNKNVSWSSSNSTVASVSNGVVTAVAAGTADITVTTEDGGKESTCKVTVKAQDVPGGHQGTLNDPLTVEEAVGLAEEIKGTASTTKTDKAYYIKGTVSEKQGSFSTQFGNFTFTMTENSKTFTAHRVKNGSSKTSFTDESDIEVGDTVVLYGTIIMYYSNSTYTPEVNGTASYDGYVHSVSKEPVAVTGVSVSPKTTTVGIGEKTSLTASVIPSNAEEQGVTWTSSNSGVASVNNGVVTGIAAGTATITVKTVDGNFTDTATITVTAPVVVTSVSVSPSTAKINVGQSTSLSVSVLPSTATNKTVSWKSSNTSVATVTNGVVKGVAVGTATITATSTDGSNKSSSATITVESGSVTPVTGEVYTIEFTASGSDASSALNSSTYTNAIETGSEYISSWDSSYAYSGANGLKLGKSGNTGSFTINLANTVSANKAVSITYKTVQYSSKSPTSSLKLNGTQVATFSEAGDCVYTLPTSECISTLEIASTTERIYVASVEINCVPAVPTDPTGISIPSTASVGINGTTELKVTYSPSGCNQNKGVTWTSSNTSVATVSNGVVTGVKAGTATITATSTFNSSFKSSCVVTVTEQQKDKWTIMIYMCGADLESENGFATSDLDEIKKVSNQPSDVNVVIETGGANSWSNTQNGCIDASKLSRFHLRNKAFVSDSKITYASMGLSSTLQSFIEWGVETYPAEKYGIIFWNHGGGQRGVCYDERKNDDSLTDNEVVSAVKNAQNSTGSGKMEFIGYDACLMQLMEIADFNAPYFNYQVASEESEAGYGWDYDTWLDDVYNNKGTPDILKAIADGFISDNGGVNATGSSYQGTYYPADQTMSYLDLSQVSAFKSAWESMAGALSSKITSSNKSSFNSQVIGKTKYFAGTDYDYFCLFDCYHFLTILEKNSTFNPGSSYITAVKTAFSNLVKYNCVQKEAAHDAYGLCFYYTAGTGYSQSSYNSATYSNYTNWINVAKNGGSLSSSYQY